MASSSAMAGGANKLTIRTTTGFPFAVGSANSAGQPFTFLPLFSPPYGHYSLIAHSQALWGYFVDNCSLDMAAPVVKDPDRVPAQSTLRRWFRSLDSPTIWRQLNRLQPDAKSAPPVSVPIVIRNRTPFCFLQKILEAIRRRLAAGEILRHVTLILSWRTLASFLHVLLPLRS